MDSMLLSISPLLRRKLFEFRASGGRLYQLARSLEVHPSQISHLANGSIPIHENDPRVIRIAEALGVPSDQAITVSERAAVPQLEALRRP